MREAAERKEKKEKEERGGKGLGLGGIKTYGPGRVNFFWAGPGKGELGWSVGYFS